jgi:hypothetical protein
VADTLHKAAHLDPSSNTSTKEQELAAQLAALQQRPSPTTAGSNAPAPPPPQQQHVSHAGGSQQQAVKVDSEIPKGLAGLEQIHSHKHAPTLVGYWCAVYDALVLSAAQLGLSVLYWAISAAGGHGLSADWR